MIFENSKYTFFYEDIVAIDKGNSQEKAVCILYMASGNFIQTDKEFVDTFCADWISFVGEANVYSNDRFSIAYNDIRGFDKTGAVPFPTTIFLEGGGFIRLPSKHGETLHDNWKRYITERATA